MIETPSRMTKIPFHAESEPDPAGLDVLSDVLRVFRATGTALLRGDFNEPWTLDMPRGSDVARMLHGGRAKIVMFHIIAEGSCWVATGGEAPVQLEKGDMIGFPHGHQHLVGAGAPGTGVRLSTLLPPPPWTGMPIVRLGADGAFSQVICVYLHCDELLFNPILSSLPAQLVVRPHGDTSPWIDATLDYIVKESLHGSPGSSGVVARLTELLFIEILRGYIATATQESKGWLAALGDRHVAKALQGFHGRPGYRWTIAELASHVGLSRSSLIDRFNRLLDLPPMSYLAMWRLQLAAQALKSTDKAVANIALDIGYDSEEAFSRAFKRHAGASPSVWRRAAKTQV